MRLSWLVFVVSLWIAREASAVTMTTQLSAPNLGTSHVGVASATTRTITVMNTDTMGASLTFTAASDNPDFTVTPPSGSVAPGMQAIVTVAFTPSARGMRTANITISGNDSANASDVLIVDGTGTSGNLTLAWTGAPGALDFGTVAIAGGTSTKQLTISNPAPANEALVVSLAITSGSSDYAAPATQQVSIPVDGNLPVTLTFDPTNAGTRTGVATITSNDAFDPMEMVNLTGFGQGAVLTATPTSIALGTVAVGAFAEQDVRIKNTGNQSAMITEITSGSSTVEATPMSALPITLAANAFTDVSVRFTPVDGSLVSTDVTFTTTGTPSSLVVPVTGDGLYADVTVAVTGEPDLALDLGSRPVGVAVDETVTVTNSGETTLDLDLPVSDDAACAVELGTPSSLPASLAPGATATFTVHVTPTAVGIGACTVSVATDLPSTDTVDIAWQGIAADVAIQSPAGATLDYGIIDVDADPVVRTVVLANTGGAPLAIGPCTVSGSTRFAVTTGCSGLVIAPGESATLMIAYDPSLETHDSATLSIAVDAESTQEVAIALGGTGADQRLELSALAVTFPDANIYSVDDPIAYVDVRNPVNPTTELASTLHIASAMIEGDVFTISNAGPFVVEGGEMIRIAITFNPEHAGEYDGTLTLVSDASLQPMAVIPLHGRGYVGEAPTGGCCDTRSPTPRSNLLLVLVVLGLTVRLRRARP